MAEQREATVLFVDDDLIEKLLRGDSVAETPKPAREVQSNALAKAIELVTAGKLDEAIEELNKAAESGKHVTDIHATLGHLWFEKRNWAEAAKHYHAVVEKDVKHQTAHYNFGLALQRQEKFEEAATEFETALVIDPKRWQAHFGRGLCLLNLRRVEEAVAALDAALQEAALALPGFDVARRSPAELELELQSRNVRATFRSGLQQLFGRAAEESRTARSELDRTDQLRSELDEQRRACEELQDRLRREHAVSDEVLDALTRLSASEAERLQAENVGHRVNLTSRVIRSRLPPSTSSRRSRPSITGSSASRMSLQPPISAPRRVRPRRMSPFRLPSRCQTI